MRPGTACPVVRLSSRRLNRIARYPTRRVPNVPRAKAVWHFALRYSCDSLSDMHEMLERLQAMRAVLRVDLASDIAVLERPLEDKGEDVTVSQHPADVASDLCAREELVNRERTLEIELADVDAALARIARGSYGICVTCGQPIPFARLEVVPFADNCVECRRLADRTRRR